MTDPAFLFYPGDYLRDTQTLSEKSQVAYDRIMCEHMRNICISQSQLKFFTKRLNDDELEELMFVLTENETGFQITWVAESIEKRRRYSESRRKNRAGKSQKKSNNISETYDKHMENGNENVIVINNIISAFSKFCENLPQIKAITAKRKSAVKARLKEHDEETVLQVLKIAGRSEFLNGKNKEGWRANFDWIFNPTNFVKIMEGNYDNDKASGTKSKYD